MAEYGVFHVDTGFCKLSWDSEEACERFITESGLDPSEWYVDEMTDEDYEKFN